MKQHIVTCDNCRLQADMVQRIRSDGFLTLKVEYVTPPEWVEYDDCDFCTDKCMAKFILAKEKN
jgi:hypothetical protein